MTVVIVGVVDEASLVPDNDDLVTEGVALEESCQYARQVLKGWALLTFPLVVRAG